jgi:hypothetical protein
MQNMMNPQVVSNLLLAVTSVLIFYKNFTIFSKLNRYLWGIFLLSISASAWINMFYYAGVHVENDWIVFVHILNLTFGTLGLLFGGWCLVMRINASPKLLAGGVVFAILLMGGIYFFKINFLAPIFYAFCILVTLIICCVGLAAREKSALWLLFGTMLLAITTKLNVIFIYIDPRDLGNYVSVFALICIGKAIRYEYEKLF